MVIVTWRDMGGGGFLALRTWFLMVDITIYYLATDIMNTKLQILSFRLKLKPLTWRRNRRKWTNRSTNGKSNVMKSKVNWRKHKKMPEPIPQRLL